MLAAAALLGLLGDGLLRATPWGVNVAICAIALLAAAVGLSSRYRPRVGPEAPALALTAALLASAYVRHASAWLGLFDLVGLALVAALALRSVEGIRLAALSVTHHLRALGETARSTTLGALTLVVRDVPWRDMPGSGRVGLLRSVVVGVVLATPVLVIFGALLASADVVFATVLNHVLVVNPDSAMGHLLGWSLCALATGGYLAALSGMSAPRYAARARAAASPASVSGTAVLTAMVLVDLLFLLFVVVQIRYLFGGQVTVLETTGLTLAEYARSGFFELVVLSAFSLPLLLAADWVIRGQTPDTTRLFRQIAGLTLVLLGVIVASALERMRLYLAEFGLSTLRVVATAFMIYLTLLFAWFAWTVLRGRRRRFAWGAVLVGFGTLALLHVANPDALVARVNLNRAAAGYRFDPWYATWSLSADAVPVLLDRVAALRAPQRCAVAHHLLGRWTGHQVADWRTWNWSRARAYRLVSDDRRELTAIVESAPCASTIRTMRRSG